MAPLSFPAPGPSKLTPAGLFTSPVRIGLIPASAGSSAPYTLVWLATVAVSAAGVIVSVGAPVKLGGL